MLMIKLHLIRTELWQRVVVNGGGRVGAGGVCVCGRGGGGGGVFN
jgi:hypothetical protein